MLGNDWHIWGKTRRCKTCSYENFAQLSELPKEIKKKKRKKENREVKRMCFFVCKTERFYIVGLIKIMGRSLKEDLNSSRCRVFFEKGYLVME